jgi:NAD(P)-dependent dehydrogenase (short-subunit alcohol dehydrogenase family)
MSGATAGALADRHAVVTGGGQGIGAAVATALAAAGAQITLMGRSEAPLRAKCQTLPVAQAVRCDVTDEAAVGAAFAEARRAFGPVNILVNNAGAAESAPFVRTSLQLLRRMLDVNLGGTFLCSRAALPDMLEAGFGRIVNVASIALKTGRSAAEAEMNLIRKNPQGRLIRPEEVAATVLWLCAPGSEAITGQTIALAGGEVT